MFRFMFAALLFIGSTGSALCGEKEVAEIVRLANSELRTSKQLIVAQSSVALEHQRLELQSTRSQTRPALVAAYVGKGWSRFGNVVVIVVDNVRYTVSTSEPGTDLGPTDIPVSIWWRKNGTSGGESLTFLCVFPSGKVRFAEIGQFEWPDRGAKYYDANKPEEEPQQKTLEVYWQKEFDRVAATIISVMRAHVR